MTPDDLAATYARAFPDSRSWTALEFQSFLDDPSCFFATRPQGFAIGRATQDEAELLTIAVSPDFQRQGVGGHLLTAFEAKAISRHVTKLFLEVAENNFAAIALYQANGYRETGRRKGYYRLKTGQKTDALLFSKSLNPS